MTKRVGGTGASIDPVEMWPYEPMVAAIERGTIHDWAKITPAVRRDPWGNVSRALEDYPSYAEHSGVTELSCGVSSGRLGSRPRPPTVRRWPLASASSSAAPGSLRPVRQPCWHFGVALSSVAHSRYARTPAVHGTPAPIRRPAQNPFGRSTARRDCTCEQTSTPELTEACQRHSLRSN